MKRKVMVRTMSIAAMFFIGTHFFAGCSGRTVDYSVDDVTENTGNRSGRKGLEQFADASAWEDEWTAVNTKGNTVTVQVNAEVFLPDAEKMSVVEVKETTIDDAFRQRMAESVFDSKSIYYYDIDHLPREELMKLREEEQELYDSYDREEVVDQDFLASIKEEAEKNLKDFDERIEAAKEVYIPAESFDVNEYLGEREGQSYEMHFWRSEADKGIVWLNGVCLDAKDIRQFCPEELKDVSDEVYCTAYSGESSTVDNQCELTEEEAKEIADRLVEDTGLDYTVCTYSTPLSWETDRTLDCYDGYVFYYDAGLDGVSFVRPGTETDYQNYYDKKKESEPQRYSTCARMTVYVNGKGIVFAEAQCPIETVSVSDNVELLALEDVRNIIKKEVTENFGKFRFRYTSEEWLVTFNAMELIYFRVRDKENPGYYSYVPTWRLGEAYPDDKLARTFIDNWVLINAIDGSVIDFYNEV